MFDVTSFPAILASIGRHFMFCRYFNWHKQWNDKWVIDDADNGAKVT